MGSHPQHPAKGCPADTRLQALQKHPLPLPLLAPGDLLVWKQAGIERHLRQQRAVPAGPLPLWKGMS